jgi:Na+-translocating ferredoxin:NAD+ oxidoreductase RnfG subunit
MRTNVTLLLLAAFSVVFVGGIAVCVAQQIRYMDSSGNLHFVDDLSQVPPRYRQQVVPYTPTPVLDKRQQQAKYRQEQALLRRKEQEERRKRMEAERRQLRLERELQKSRKKAATQEGSTGFESAR